MRRTSALSACSWRAISACVARSLKSYEKAFADMAADGAFKGM